jgi:hypothetical protein
MRAAEDGGQTADNGRADNVRPFIPKNAPQ